MKTRLHHYAIVGAVSLGALVTAKVESPRIKKSTQAEVQAWDRQAFQKVAEKRAERFLADDKIEKNLPFPLNAVAVTIHTPNVREVKAGDFAGAKEQFDAQLKAYGLPPAALFAIDSDTFDAIGFTDAYNIFDIKGSLFVAASQKMLERPPEIRAELFAHEFGHIAKFLELAELIELAQKNQLPEKLAPQEGLNNSRTKGEDDADAWALAHTCDPVDMEKMLLFAQKDQKDLLKIHAARLQQEYISSMPLQERMLMLIPAFSDSRKAALANKLETTQKIVEARIQAHGSHSSFEKRIETAREFNTEKSCIAPR